MEDFNLDDYEEISERELHEIFDDFLDEVNKPVVIFGIQYSPSHVLRNTDYTAYRTFFDDWLDTESDIYIEHNGDYYIKK